MDIDPSEGFLNWNYLLPCMSRLTRYIQDTRREMAHVSWPTRVQTIAYTLIVVGICAFAAIYLSFFDAVFTQGLRAALDNAPRFTQSAAATNPIVTTPIASTTPTGSSTPAFTVDPNVTPAK
jgi:preprotein translocase subunit SecE